MPRGGSLSGNHSVSAWVFDVSLRVLVAKFQYLYGYNFLSEKSCMWKKMPEMKLCLEINCLNRVVSQKIISLLILSLEAGIF